MTPEEFEVLTARWAEEESKAKSLDHLVWGLALIPPCLLLDSWVITLLWKWFVTPFGVQAVGIWQAIGLLVLVKMLIGTRVPPSKKHPLDLAISGAMLALVLLGIGALVHLGMPA